MCWCDNLVCTLEEYLPVYKQLVKWLDRNINKIQLSFEYKYLHTLSPHLVKLYHLIYLLDSFVSGKTCKSTFHCTKTNFVIWLWVTWFRIYDIFSSSMCILSVIYIFSCARTKHELFLAPCFCTPTFATPTTQSKARLSSRRYILYAPMNGRMNGCMQAGQNTHLNRRKEGREDETMQL